MDDSEAASAPGFWAGRGVLVTGGCGFIGSHLVETLLSVGADVLVLDAYNSTSSLGFLQGIEDAELEIRLGDVADPFLLRELTAGVDTVFHLAALIGIPYSYLAPAHYVRTNVEGTLAVLEAARAETVRRVVHTSTSETYGSAQFVPMDESHPLVAQSPYAATKVAADQLAGSYFRSFDVPVTIVRAFNTFGPRQSMRALLPTLMVQALYGDRIVVGALDPVRDMTYVTDTVSALMAAATADDVEGEVFNVGSGRGRTVREMLNAVQRVAGVELPVIQAPERVRPERSEVRELVCAFGKATRALGYRPTVDFEEGLALLREHLLSEGSPANATAYRV